MVRGHIVEVVSDDRIQERIVDPEVLHLYPQGLAQVTRANAWRVELLHHAQAGLGLGESDAGERRYLVEVAHEEPVVVERTDHGPCGTCDRGH